MKTEIEKIVEAPGILAAAHTEDSTTQVRVSDGGDLRKWAPILDRCRQVMVAANTDEVKITFDDYSVLVMRSQSTTLGVVVSKAHPIIKSLKRMLRRTFKRLGKTVAAAPKQRPQEPVTVPDQTRAATPAPVQTGIQTPQEAPTTAPSPTRTNAGLGWGSRYD